MTDGFEEGRWFGAQRLHEPLVETLQIAAPKGEAYLGGVVSGLIEAAKRLPPTESFRGAARDVVRNWRRWNRELDRFTPPATRHLDSIGSAVDRMDAAIFEFES